MTGPTAGGWFADDDHPFDDARSMKQIDGVLRELGKGPRRVLELGCGGGRVLTPLCAAGHTCVGIDHDAAALERCAEAIRNCGDLAELIQHDFLQPWPKSIRRSAEPFDAVLCLGNTFMTVSDVDDAAALLLRCRALLTPGGVVMLDDLPGEHWPELAEGNWQAGLSADGASQLVWAPDDAVFALRRGEDVDSEDWALRETDRRLRLWTAGALRLAARLAGLSAPRALPEANLLAFGSERAGGGCAT